MKHKLKVAGVQVAATENVEHNLSRALELAEHAVQNEAKVICFAELFSLPWFPAAIDKKAFELAEPLSGPTVTKVREKAKEWEAAVVLPLFEKGDDGGLYNSAVVIGPEGEVMGVYRKMHIPQVPGWEEKSYFSPGNLGFPVFKAFDLSFGVQICWDNFFPEGPRVLALSGARLIFAPTANLAANADLWRQSICNNAFVNGCYVVRVNRVGQEGGKSFMGGSFCAAPTGDLIEEPMGEVEGVGLWTIDLQAVDFVRREWPFLRDRRPRQYMKIAGLKIVKDPANDS